MDIDIKSVPDIYSSYIQQTADNVSSVASQIDTSKDYSKASDDELMEACKKFESYFLEQCFKEMMKTTGEDEKRSASMSTLVDYYKDSFAQKVAEESTEGQGLGLAQMLYEQMKRNYDL